jgi:hypothetical protein
MMQYRNMTHSQADINLTNYVIRVRYPFPLFQDNETDGLLVTSSMTSGEEHVKMAVQEDNAVRMAGYLDKRGKMVSCNTRNFPVKRSAILCAYWNP